MFQLPGLLHLPQWVPLKLFQNHSGTVNIKGLEVKALFDNGRTKSSFHPRLAKKVALAGYPSAATVSMASSTSSTISITGT